ncbi:GntR family transcriptional repressor for pyruvate dehydrogenase complex [Sphingomonas naasensis]|uniref:FadR family transcriptional regulator n=1 Tax=Sphingomonas naasensis TaxID=1344951 RepID=A0A4S1WMX3_9SPHN|nr:FadR/GntR family transcriptional regulator [Sphingomonas naasensis]NIJ20041.1 GntR family transcriptional repressor for pyruvate dehydrogenase complex [Sphingomonas naasensis]TGX44203.1 FadR family transcriptional regulator [Sphingomonas naasensis]
MKITGNKLYQRVAASITAAIEAGRWSPGTRLPGERDLAEEYKVSRPTIREAMIALEMKGWIEARHGSGLYVTKREHGSGQREDSLNFDVGAFDLTEARILFEGEAVALAAVSISDEQLAEIDQLLIEMGADDSNEPSVMDADRRFHLAIADATGNEAVRSVIEYLWDLRTRSPLAANMFARAKRGGITPRVEEHRPIVAALRARDPHAARSAMRKHLRGVVDDLLEATELEALERTRSEIDARRDSVARRLKIGSV